MESQPINALLSPYRFGALKLPNRFVMSPMTRCRAIGNIPTDLMAEYYCQRASAGLIITEGIAPSPNGLGYPRTAGLYSPAQIEGWHKVTDAVHKAGGRIFAQLMHAGRIAHPVNMPDGTEILAPSAITAGGEMRTDTRGAMKFPMPRAMELQDIVHVQQEFAQAAVNAIEAGFDGIELHAANGYLLDQFLEKCTNKREDQYGGSPENRNQFVLEVSHLVSEAVSREKVGIRISPQGTVNDMEPFEGIEEQFIALAQQLSSQGLAYLHLVDHSSMGSPPVSMKLKEDLRQAFKGTFILSGGYDRERAEADLNIGLGDLVAFGRPFLANLDLIDRFREGVELNTPRSDFFYTSGSEGYTDYPVRGNGKMQPPEDSMSWDQMYVDGVLPWDTNIPDQNLSRVIQKHGIKVGRAVEIGCGTGTNSIWLAQHGFDVTGLDVSKHAIAMAENKLADTEIDCQFCQSDFLVDRVSGVPFIFAFDIACFHIFRSKEERLLFSLRIHDLLSAGGIWYSLIGSTDGPLQDTGPPRLNAVEIASSVEPYFEILELSSTQFNTEDLRDVRAWVMVAQRRS